MLPCLVTESGISVIMQGNLSVNEGDRLKLTCKVDGVKGQLSVTWQHKSTSASTDHSTSFISLSQEGVMEKHGDFRNRKVRAARPATDTFTLELDEITPSDSGVYQCAVSEWAANSRTNSQSQTATVKVNSIGETCPFSVVHIVQVSNDETRALVRQFPFLKWSLKHHHFYDHHFSLRFHHC